MLYRFKFKSFGRIAISLVVVLMVIVVGSVGFMILEDYTFVEAFYMTMITVSTVGFREVHELSPNGMIFTSLLIIFSIGTFAYTISAVTTYFVAGEYRDLFKARKLERIIDTLKDHVIVCGYGRVGEKAYADLLDKGYEVVIVEKDEELVSQLREDLTPLVVPGGNVNCTFRMRSARRSGGTSAPAPAPPPSCTLARRKSRQAYSGPPRSPSERRPVGAARCPTPTRSSRGCARRSSAGPVPPPKRPFGRSPEAGTAAPTAA